MSSGLDSLAIFPPLRRTPGWFRRAPATVTVVALAKIFIAQIIAVDVQVIDVSLGFHSVMSCTFAVATARKIKRFRGTCVANKQISDNKNKTGKPRKIKAKRGCSFNISTFTKMKVVINFITFFKFSRP